MPKTVVGLFENAARAQDAVREIEALGLPSKDVQTLREPAGFTVAGVMSFPRLDFETDLSRELTRIGASIPEARSYIDGLRGGGALCFATGSDENVDAAGHIMNLHGAVEVAVESADTEGREPRMPAVHRPNLAAIHDSPVLAGRVRDSGDGARFFVW